MCFIPYSLSVMVSDNIYSEHGIIPVFASGSSNVPHYSLSVL